MRCRVRGPQGVASITLDDSATWGQLKHEISEKTGVPDFDLKYGYPPQPFNAESIDNETRVGDLEVKLDGEQIVVVPHNIQAELSSPLSGSKPPGQAVKPLPPQDLTSPPQHQLGDFPDQPPAHNKSRKPNPGDVETDPPEIPVPQLEGVMVLRVMPDDNSCMFRALSTAVLGSALDGMTELRSVVAQTIQAKPDFFTAGMLEKEPSDYCRWITREDAWGGGIELAILSEHFDIEICSINVQDLRVDTFNEGKPTRCILVYSGIHYDVLAVTPFAGADPGMDRKVFQVLRLDGEEMDGGALEAAKELCRELQKRHYFTDTFGFDIKCNQCGAGGKGQQWVVQHAKESGHMDFGE